MKVLFVGKRFYTNRDALEERYGRIHQLPWNWAELGIETRLWLIDYHGWKTRGLHDGNLAIESTPVRNFAAPFSFFRKMLLARRRRSIPDVIVASGDCYIGLLGWLLARRIGARFVFDVYDKYDEFPGYRSLPGTNLFQMLLRKSDARLFASRALMSDLSSDASRDWLVQNGIDTRRFAPLDTQASRTRMSLSPGATYIGYFGSMEEDRGVDDLVAAVGHLNRGGKKVELLLGGKLRPGIRVDQPWVNYLGNIPYMLMPHALASCDVLAIPYRRSTFMDAGASNKIIEAIACGKPIVSTRTPNFVDNFPEQARENLLASPGDPMDLAKAIARQLENRELVEMPPGFGWPDIAGRVAGHLHRLLGEVRTTT